MMEISRSDDPVHANETPPDFEPLSAPEITRKPNHFTPGTVIVSNVTRSKVHFPKLSILIHLLDLTSVREGGILVLPDGASREDYIPNPSRWYSHIYEVQPKPSPPHHRMRQNPTSLLRRHPQSLTISRSQRRAQITTIRLNHGGPTITPDHRREESGCLLCCVSQGDTYRIEPP